MRTVIYAEDMLPITVVDIPQVWIETMQRGEYVLLAAYPPIPLSFEENFDLRQTLKTVALRMEPLMRNGRRHWLCFTVDEETALTLKAAFLPGQLGEVQRREQSAYFQGLLSGLF